MLLCGYASCLSTPQQYSFSTSTFLVVGLFLQRAGVLGIGISESVKPGQSLTNKYGKVLLTDQINPGIVLNSIECTQSIWNYLPERGKKIDVVKCLVKTRMKMVIFQDKDTSTGLHSSNFVCTQNCAVW